MGRKIEVRRAEYKVFYSFSTRWQDNDNFGRVNNVNYYSFFDSAVNSFLVNHCGLDIHRGEVIPQVVSSGCEYLSPLSFPDKIDIGIRVDQLGSSSVQYSVAIFKVKEPAASAFGHFVHVFVDRLSVKPEPIPGLIRDALAKLADDQKH